MTAPVGDAPTLVQKVLALHLLLAHHGIGHVFGGAIALAYCAEPRATRDIDLNLAVAPEQASDVFAVLPDGVDWGEGDLAAVERDGQVRIWWGHTPLDLFLRYHAFHDRIIAGARLVPFADGHIPVMAGEDLVVCKAMFDRAKDWVDIDAIAADGRTDLVDACRQLAELVGEDNPRVARLRAVAGAHR